MIDTAMILAAGLGTRMRPLTNHCPKALVQVAGQPLLAHILDRLAADGIRRLVVNTHYCADQVADFLARETRFTSITLSPEPVLLETGGGILNALPLLNPDAEEKPFFAVNCDSFWHNGYESSFTRMRALWDTRRMDGLLMLQPTVTVPEYDGPGDFRLDPLGHLTRRPPNTVTPFVYTGVQLLHPRLFQNTAAGVFSLNRLYNQAIEQRRLFGFAHDGVWFHVGTPADVTLTEQRLQRA